MKNSKISVLLVLLLLFAFGAGCGHDDGENQHDEHNGHDHHHNHGNDDGALPSVVVEALCSGELPDVAEAVSVAGDGEPIEVEIDGDPQWFEAEETGEIRFQFEIEMDHVDLRIMIGHGGEFNDLDGATEGLFFASEVTDEACAEDWAYGVHAHFHHLGTWEVIVDAVEGEPFLFAIVLEGVGH